MRGRLPRLRAAGWSFAIVLVVAVTGLLAVSGGHGDPPADGAEVSFSPPRDRYPVPNGAGRHVARQGASRLARFADRRDRHGEQECGEVVGNPAAPYMNALAHRYALAVNAHGIRHPSGPNYLALTGGSTFGHTSDCRYCLVPASSLVDQLEEAGISWKAYMEEVPYPCYRGGSAGTGAHRYVKELDPFLSYAGIYGDAERCSHVVPLTDLAADLASGKVPQFAWITPNLCHSGHSCPLAAADSFLSRLLPPLLRRLERDGLLFVTWDEGAEHGHRGCCALVAGGNIATIVAGGAARRGAVSTVPYDHYSLLRTIEEAWGLPKLRGAACACTRAMFNLVVRPRVSATTGRRIESRRAVRPRTATPR